MGLFSRSEKSVYSVFIQTLNKAVSVSGKTTVLQAALEAGLPFPYSCGAGTCSTCKCKLVEGSFREKNDMSFVLSREELDAGYILACQTIPTSDLVVTLDENSDQAREFQAQIVSSENLNHDIKELVIRLDRPMTYLSGQYADLYPAGIDGGRSYSMAQPALPKGNTELHFHVRKVPGGAFTSWLFDTDQKGQKFGVKGPRGHFYLRPDDAPLVFIAGGSGLAPILAILQEAVSAGLQRQVLLLYGARTQADLYCTSEIKAIQTDWKAGFEFRQILSHEPADSDWTGLRGFVTEHIKTDAFRIKDAHAYMCGPPPMIDAAIPVLEKLGIRRSDIHFDKFTDKSHST